MDTTLAERLSPFTAQDAASKASYFAALRSFEDGYDKAQGLLRTIASAWLLLTLAALATVTANDAACLANLPAMAADAEPTGASPPGVTPQGCSYPFGSLARFLILLAAALGITSLWYLDQRVYQSLLHSVFVLGVKLEEQDQQLPPVRTVLQQLNQDITRHLSWFYRAPLLAFLLLQVLNVAIFQYLLRNHVATRFNEATAGWEGSILTSWSAVAVLIQLGILVWAEHWPSLRPHGRSIDGLMFPATVQPPAQPPELKKQVDAMERRLSVLEQARDGGA